MNVFNLQTRTPAPAKIAPAVLFTPVRQHRERDFGVGYGSSSGYATNRRYANSPFKPLFRCA
ncbi:hypothetical protein [Agrilutibacter solisilvae]|uniref:Uncharacterized protein n=1 Tax=Agrilutibacter solisilvae TaxID=2763317 RepID=A0A974Y1X9_9GAMM|nr:hypothetical protein [Lysobacter solisilvae]QSX79100.1 hypothetical protein I8J32_004130 [Lysobacter solisilvae]